MATAISYTVTPDPNPTLYGSTFHRPAVSPLNAGQNWQQSAAFGSMAGFAPGQLMSYQPGTTVVQTTTSSANPFQPTITYAPPVITGQPPMPQYLNSAAAFQPPAQSGNLQESAFVNSAVRRSRSQTGPNEVATTTSHVSGVVPTGLYTSYVPATQLPIKDQHNLMKSGSRKPVTVYYTDDLYPPYYAKAKKVSATKKRTGCCA